MSLLDNIKDKVKDASEKASSVVAKEYKKQQQKVADRKEEKTKILALEEARHQKIIAGQLESITVSMNLQPDEKAYLELTARRMASVDSIVSETIGTSKKKHIIRRAVVGGVLTGGVGAIVGGATAGSKQNSTTTQKTVTSMELVDSGQLILTNKRFIFLGNDGPISLPYEEIIAAGFSNNQVKVKYAGMLNGEYYEVFGPAAKDTQLYYNGITQHHKPKQNKVAAVSPASTPQGSVADELIKLAKLKEQGVITQDEFDAKKKQLLEL